MTARVTFTNGNVLNASDLTNSFVYLPYAMESDTDSGTGTITINFTSGRFSVAPILLVTVVSGNNTATSATIGSISASSATINVWSGTSAATTSKTIHWTAIQMTSSTAAG